MSVAVVQSATAQNAGGGPAPAVFTDAPTAGNLLLFAVGAAASSIGDFVVGVSLGSAQVMRFEPAEPASTSAAPARAAAASAASVRTLGPWASAGAGSPSTCCCRGAPCTS